MKVLTYNLFGSDDPENYFAHRLEALLQLILKQQADILCLQEAHPQQIRRLVDDFGYDVSYDMTEALQTEKRKVFTEYEKSYLRMNGVAVILVKKTSGFEVLDRRLVFEGDMVDTGALCVKLRKNDTVFYIYNNHFTGGSYGLKDQELKRRQNYRIDQYKMLADDIVSTAKKEVEDKALFLVAGDFNSDAEKLEQFPEASKALELILPPNNDILPFGFVDAWNALRNDTGGNGATESTSRNKFRAHLKPHQQREVRFDRILLGVLHHRKLLQSSHGSVHLIGDEPVDCVVRDQEGNAVPIFPSDHFGVVAVLDDNCIFG